MRSINKENNNYLLFFSADILYSSARTLTLNNYFYHKFKQFRSRGMAPYGIINSFYNFLIMLIINYYYWSAKARQKATNKKNKNNMSSVFTLLFFRMFGCSLISQELLNKTYIFVHHQTEIIELNQRINMMCFICHFNVQSHRHQICDFSRDIILYDFVHSNIGTIFDSTNYS